MEYIMLDKIREYLNILSTTIKEKTYPENDVRRDFYALVFDVINNYYRTITAFYIAKDIRDGKVRFSEDVFSAKDHIENLINIHNIQKDFDSYLNSLNRRLLIDSWTAFEFSLSTITEFILQSGDNVDELIDPITEDILKLLKKNSITESVINSVKEKLLKHNISSMPFMRKFRALTESYFDKEKRKKDMEFLDMYSTMRNCMVHSNSIYHGKNKTFQYWQWTIEFVDGKLFTTPVNYKDMPNFMINIIQDLMNVFSRLEDHVRSIDYIPYPDFE